MATIQPYTSIHSTTKDTPALKSFTTIAENDLFKLIMEMPTKTCENDIIPTKLLKEILPTIIPSLTKIANPSINKGVFSKKWKSATVKPLIKSQSKGTTHQKLQTSQQFNLPLQSC